MTDTEKLEMLKNLITTDDTEEVLSSYLTLAGKKILNKAYPYNPEIDEVPTQYEYLQIEIAQFMLNKRGAEGQVTHSENGIQRQYEKADVPTSMLQNITPYCGVIK